MGQALYRKRGDNIRYDSRRGIPVGEADNMESCKDLLLDYWIATLFRTPKSGHYFLCGHGAFLTRFAQGSEYGMQGGDDIIPLTHEQAREFAIHFLPWERTAKEFPELGIDVLQEGERYGK